MTDHPIVQSAKRNKGIAQHSSNSVEHYTPREIVEAARLTMGGIDLDPASCAEANETVKAESFFHKGDDGLTWPWWHWRTAHEQHPSRVFLNPPGGKLANKSVTALWWKKLTDEFALGRVAQFVFVGFTLEILRTTQDADKYGPEPCLSPKFALCFPRDRICFGGQNSPTHANVIVYGGPHREAFVHHFAQFGWCR